MAQVVIAVSPAGQLRGTMTVGVVQAFFQYVNQTAEPLTEASYMINALQAALASARRIYDLLDQEEERPDPARPAALAHARGSIAFEHVSFGYDPDRPLMRDISFTVRPGQKVAVVGATGAGKTTLINLLMRFYEVDGGRITLDGVSTAGMTRAGLRQNFGMVLQDTWLFGGTVAENIAYGRPGAAREEISAAAKAAKADAFIRAMPQGYDTPLDNEAANLSAGQRQLLTIARVFLCDPPILILDEATSSVDTRTEREIGRAMTALMHGRTSFVIAHRLSTIRDADLICLWTTATSWSRGTTRPSWPKTAPTPPSTTASSSENLRTPGRDAASRPGVSSALPVAISVKERYNKVRWTAALRPVPGTWSHMDRHLRQGYRLQGDRLCQNSP